MPTLRGIPDLLAFLVAIPAGILLCASARGGTPTFGAALFSVGLALMLGISGTYHTFKWGPERRLFWARLDHAGIFVLIAASYTPFCLSTPLTYGPYILGLAWACSLFGILYVVTRPHASRAIRASIYILLGVLILPNVLGLYHAVPGQTFALLCSGGASYIVGAGVYVARRPNPIPNHFGHHEVFHLFVFAGAACHYAAIWQVVT